MDKPSYLGFAIRELSRLYMYETYYDKFQHSFGQDKLKKHYMDCDSFVLSSENQNIKKNLKNWNTCLNLVI